MNIIINEDGGRMTVALIGELDNTASRKAETDLTPVVEQDNNDVVIDCKDLGYISSSGLRLLLNIYKHQRSIGKRSILTHMNDYIREVFLIGGFLNLFETEE